LINTHRNLFLQSLAESVADFRLNEITPITSTHVERWLHQFNPEDQPTILSEMASIMQHFYYSKTRIKECLRNFLSHDVFGSCDPRVLLPHISFLRIQRKGSSQRAMLALVDEILYEEYNCSLNLCATSNVYLYVYVDDALYTGNRLRYDLTFGTNAPSWIINDAPYNCILMIYTVAAHSFGKSYAETHINEAARQKGIKVYWKYSLLIDDTRSVQSKAEMLWPEALYYNQTVNNYILQLRSLSAQRNGFDYDFFRFARVPYQETLFSSAKARRIVETAFLTKGVQIIAACQTTASSLRPLGFMKLSSLGFGTFFTTYRNIANNCPLVLWWGVRGWYPLFPRSINEQESLEYGIRQSVSR
jgi:hypothetical protein